MKGKLVRGFENVVHRRARPAGPARPVAARRPAGTQGCDAVPATGSGGMAAPFLRRPVAPRLPHRYAPRMLGQIVECGRQRVQTQADPLCRDGIAGQRKSPPRNARRIAPARRGNTRHRTATRLRSGLRLSNIGSDSVEGRVPLLAGRRGASSSCHRLSTGMVCASTITSRRAAASAGRNSRNTAHRRWRDITGRSPASPAMATSAARTPFSACRFTSIAAFQSMGPPLAAECGGC